MTKRRMYFLSLALVGLVILLYQLFNSADYHLFIKPDVGGHGHGYLYYDDGIWTHRVHVGYETESGLRYADLSPDGSRIAFKQRSFLFIFDLSSNQLTQLNTEPLYPSESTSIQWSPDGSQIGFPCRLEYKEPIEVCVWDIVKDELQVLSDLHPIYGKFDYLSFGGWSADGKTIALVIFPEDSLGRNRQLILTLDTSTGHTTTVLDSRQAGLNIDFEIASSPDGKTILFNSSDTRALYQVNADGSGLHQLKDKISVHPVWSPDGRSFYINTINDFRLIVGPFQYFLLARYDLSGRLIGVLPFQLGRWMLSWRSAPSGQ